MWTCFHHTGAELQTPQALSHWATRPVCTALLTSENHLGQLHIVCLPTVESNSWTFWKRLQSDNTKKITSCQGWGGGKDGRVGPARRYYNGGQVSLLCNIAQGPKMCTLRVSLNNHYGLSGCWLCVDIDLGNLTRVPFWWRVLLWEGNGRKSSGYKRDLCTFLRVQWACNFSKEEKKIFSFQKGVWWDPTW